jgi:hypothetical protein
MANRLSFSFTKTQQETSMIHRIGSRSAILILLVNLFLQTTVFADYCEKVVQAFNVRLSPGIDEP